MPSNPLPYLRNTTGNLNAQCLYPFDRIVSCLTNVVQFQSAAEQRSVARPPLYGFNLPMGSLNAVDRAAWLAYQVANGGRFHTDLQLTLGATTYSNLTLMSDSLTHAQHMSLFYDQVVSLRQVAAANFSSYTPPAIGSAYPVFKFGYGSNTTSRTELPFSRSNNLLTSVGDSPYGPRYAFSWYGTGLVGFPTTYLGAWKLTYPLLDATDIATLESFFLGCQGMYATFDFTDPQTNTVFHNVRFNSDELAIRYLTVNQYSTEVSLMQVNV